MWGVTALAGTESVGDNRRDCRWIWCDGPDGRRQHFRFPPLLRALDPVKVSEGEREGERERERTTVSSRLKLFRSQDLLDIDPWGPELPQLLSYQ